MTSSEDTHPAGKPDAGPRLGTLLVERGLLTAAQLQEALLEQQREGVPLGQAVVRLGFVSPATVAQALATQHGGLAKTEFGMAVGFDTTLAGPERAAPPVSVDDLGPALHSAEEAGDYMRALRQLVRWLGVSEGNMEQGQLRCDANVSLRPAGATALGTRAELKNINSFRFVERAIAHEIDRQARILSGGGRQGTSVQQRRRTAGVGAQRQVGVLPWRECNSRSQL